MANKNKPKNFWNFARSDTGERELHIDGPIASEMWFGDEITPQAFRDELFADSGDITVWIRSDGGNVIAAAEIYEFLNQYSGNVMAKIYGMCASAASVIAMAADEVLMSATSYMLVHNPWTIAIGDADMLRKTAAELDEIKKGIAHAYEIKTGMSSVQISHLMNADSPMCAKTAIDFGFADGLLEDRKKRKCCNSAAPIQNAVADEITIKSQLERLKIIGGIYS